MLTVADAGVVARDPELAALGLLLDSEALGGWLSDHTALSCTVRPLRLRYKQGTSCVLAFELVSITGSTLCVAKAYCADGEAKMVKSVRQAAVGAVIAFDPSVHLLVTTLTADRDLPVLAALHDDDARRKVLGRVLPGSRTPAAPRTVRYNPERRWVGVVDTGEGAVLLRSYRGRDVGRHARSYAALEGHGPPTPRLLGVSRRYGTAAVEWAPGRELTGCTGAVDDFAAAGAALAQLHRSAACSLEPVSAQSQVRAARAAGQQIDGLLPDLAAQAGRLADLVAHRIRRLGRAQAVLHGDFSTDQVVIGADRRVTLIDLDSAGIGDPAIDLGCATAGLAAGGGADADQLVEAMHAGYAAVRPLPSADNLAVHRAAHLLRRAGEPFRSRDADWPERMRELLDLAEGELAVDRDRRMR